MVDVEGNTALHGAAVWGSNGAVELLVQHGAPLDVKNKARLTPWRIAEGAQFEDSVSRQPHTAELLRRLLEERRLKVEVSLSVTDIERLPQVPLGSMSTWRGGDGGSMLLITSAMPVSADSPDVFSGYRLSSWGPSDGLTAGVYALAQDAAGFPWLGTETGLSRFDG